jgi:hypothetical protein
LRLKRKREAWGAFGLLDFNRMLKIFLLLYPCCVIGSMVLFRMPNKIYLFIYFLYRLIAIFLISEPTNIYKRCDSMNILVPPLHKNHNFPLVHDDIWMAIHGPWWWMAIHPLFFFFCWGGVQQVYGGRDIYFCCGFYFLFF